MPCNIFCRDDIGRMYGKIVDSVQEDFFILSKIVCFRRNLRAHFRESLGSHVYGGVEILRVQY